MILKPITSDHLGTRHGFFTRQGGVSDGIYRGLNCGVGSSDKQDAVSENRSRVTSHFGAGRLVTVHQVHSSDVVVAENVDLTKRPKADALVTAEPGLALGVLTADCTPVLFSDSTAGVIGAAHAGWKGALAGILENTIAAMVRLGASRDRIAAVAGPTISQANYEVGQEFLETFEAEDPETLRFFAAGRTPEKYQFDLPGFALSRLREAGVDATWTGHCTYGDADQFFSYRRTTHAKEPDYGRQISVVTLGD
ncbi:MAG: peptidoglycan editing factor PgeF [Pseudomonadota bacterium]